ncbi:LytTR family transcriptional regulator DNA-binding domain-containing protein [Chitinophaga sedimenti]|nr:LytTR family DNA-binding domain-containing protein [Chitinophaga sedimenti]MCK7558539.1 LytTR family transcriptional regulator DNA-binding domain-containing protein [Chitinophaga sedimenti]
MDKDELVEAVDKALAKRQDGSDKHVNSLMQYLYQHIQPNERLAFPTMDGLRMMAIKDITYCESEGGYTRVFTQQSEKPLIICRTLKEVEEVLGEKGFSACTTALWSTSRTWINILRAMAEKLS